MTTSYYRSRI